MTVMENGLPAYSACSVKQRSIRGAKANLLSDSVAVPERETLAVIVSDIVTVLLSVEVRCVVGEVVRVAVSD